jgi:predicted proteasome-type protease
MKNQGMSLFFSTRTNIGVTVVNLFGKLFVSGEKKFLTIK